MTPIRVVLADDHPLILDALEQLFRTEGDIDVVGRCMRGDDVTGLVRRQRPDVLILDHVMKGANSIEVLRELQGEPHVPRTIILSAHIKEDEINEAIRLGATCVLMKEQASRDVITCVRDVYAGRDCLEQQTGPRGVRLLVRREFKVREESALLTTRELELVRYLAAGLRNREIGERLDISEGTVKTHLHNIYEKVGVEGRVSLVVWAKERGLV